MSVYARVSVSECVPVCTSWCNRSVGETDRQRERELIRNLREHILAREHILTEGERAYQELWGGRESLLGHTV